MKNKKNSILIVDDESSDILTLTHILSPEYTVYASRNGQHAISAAEKYLPDLILLDIVMPEVDGYTVITTLKNNERTKRIPVIFITGLSSQSDEEKGFLLGASDYIIKPFSPAIVKLRVQNQMKMIDQLRTIERLSMTDQLTELPNRRSFETRLNTEWRRAQREQTPLSILMIDVDRFKNHNDAFGHQQGDVALKTMAKVFTMEIKRPSDFVARWGGEEFVVLLPDTDIQGAYYTAERIRESIEKTKIVCSDGSVTQLTVSIGINTTIPEQDSIRDNFISIADKALYKVKDEGRNKVGTLEGNE